ACGGAPVRSRATLLGAPAAYTDELAPRPPRLRLRSPILTTPQLVAIERAEAFAPIVLDLTFAIGKGAKGVHALLKAIADDACAAVERGTAILVLSDRLVDAARAAVPALLATAAVHHALIDRGLR